MPVPTKSESILGRRRRGEGFTLVELLVVIGIIALLISILLPSLSKARATAQRTACQAKLHNIMLAAILHRNNHHDYYPLAGVLPGATPESLDDPYATKYDYYSCNLGGVSGSPRQLATIADALSTQMADGRLIFSGNGIMGVPDEATREKLMLDGTGFIKSFLCPSHALTPLDINPQHVLMYYGAPINPEEPQSYIFNEFVLGYDDGKGDDSTGRLGGRAAGVWDPTRTVFAADGFGGNPVAHTGVSAPQPMYTVYNLTNVRPVALADALANRAGYAGDSACFDLKRHNKLINVAFCDGHVESRQISQNGLADVRINNVKYPPQ